MKVKKQKWFTTEEVREHLKTAPKPPIVNPALKKKITKIVTKLVAEEFREEALEILLASSREKLGEFLYYYYSDIGNVACLVIDFAKMDLVKQKKMKQKKTDNFGKMWNIKIAKKQKVDSFDENFDVRNI